MVSGASCSVSGRRRMLVAAGAAAVWPLGPGRADAQSPASAKLLSWALNTPQPAGIHDLAPAPDGGVWFTAQRSGHLGWFDPASGKTALVALGERSAPHGVIAGPDGAAWITDGGQNAIVRVGWPARVVTRYPLPAGSAYANLNTCAFDGTGDLWFTGQSGYVGRLALRTGQVTVKEAPRGRGPYGIWCNSDQAPVGQCVQKIGRAHV